MNNIKIVVLNKYFDITTYSEVAHGVYKNLKKQNYCMCFEADRIDQYPLEDLLDQYRLNCTNDYCGEKVTLNGETKWLAEVETSQDSIEDLVKLLNFCTIIGKEIVNFSLDGYAILCVNYGMTDVIINNTTVKVPILGCRHDPWGSATFNIRYPEMQLQSMFRARMGQPQSHKIPRELPDGSAFKALLLKNYFSYLVYTENHEYKAIVFNQQRALRIEKGSALVNLIRGYM